MLVWNIVSFVSVSCWNILFQSGNLMSSSYSWYEHLSARSVRVSSWLRVMFRAAAREHCACWFVSMAVVVLMASPDRSGRVLWRCVSVGDVVLAGIVRGVGCVCCAVGLVVCGRGVVCVVSSWVGRGFLEGFMFSFLFCFARFVSQCSGFHFCGS